MDVIVRRKRNGKTWVLVLLWLLLVLSCLTVVYVAHENREKFNQLEQLKREAYKQEVKWSQLLLEKSTWSSYNHIEKQAMKRLHMKPPAVKELVLIEP